MECNAIIAELCAVCKEREYGEAQHFRKPSHTR